MLTSTWKPEYTPRAQEIWEELGNDGPVFRRAWPAFDPELAKEDEAEIVVQVNGKVRSSIEVPAGADRAVIEAAALADPKVRSYASGKTVAQVILVPGRLVNVVVP